MDLNKIYNMDCLEGMKQLSDNSVDAIVTDPPYGLSFMGKKWDYDVPKKEVWVECLRVLKHGGYLLSFAGSRTYHRIAINIEDAGFEIRDQIMWIYGSGFPKSLNIGKAIDKMEGVQHPENTVISENNSMSDANYTRNKMAVQSDLGKLWGGWGTALKPAHEPIVVARKPLSEKTVALNVLKWGVGGINIDACRIATNPAVDDMLRKVDRNKRKSETWDKGSGFKNETNELTGVREDGRFPSNIILDEEAGRVLDEQSGELTSGSMKKEYTYTNNGFSLGAPTGKTKQIHESNSGGASRFFYCAKSSKSERNALLEGMQEVENSNGDKWSDVDRRDGKVPVFRKNFHPTVKPLSLMKYLVKLVSKEESLVLDPFIGSGSTAVACQRLNRKFIGFELEEGYVKIANKRLSQKPIREWF